MPVSEYVKNLRKKIGTDLLLLPSVGAIVFNEAGEVLLARRADNGRWAVIGGMLDPGENPADGIIREVFEETGVYAVPERITGVYLTQVVTYADGNRSQYVVTMFRCRHVSGTPRAADDESLEVRYFPVDAMPELSVEHGQRVLEAAGPGPAHFVLPQMKEPT